MTLDKRSFFSSPPPFAGLLQSVLSGWWRVLTSSSRLHYNLQLFPHIFPILVPEPRFWRMATSVRQIRAFEPCARPVPSACAVLADQTTVHSHWSRPTCGHFFCYPSEPLWRAHTYDYNPSAASFLVISQEKGKDATPQQKLWQNNACHQSRAGKSPLLSNSTAPPTGQSVFVSHLNGSGWINSESHHIQAYDRVPRLTCESCVWVRGRPPTVPVGHSGPPQLSVLVPQQTTREHDANQTDTPRLLCWRHNTSTNGSWGTTLARWIHVTIEYFLSLFHSSIHIKAFLA